MSVPDPESLARSLRDELKRLRGTQKIPTEIRLSQETYNAIRGQLTYGPFGPRRVVLFEGLPCAIAFGLQGAFRVRYVEART